MYIDIDVYICVRTTEHECSKRRMSRRERKQGRIADITATL